jgi:hypothetical protein
VPISVQDDTGPCYKMPAGVRHLSDRDWHSTLQLLVFYAYIQIIVIIVAVIWDVSKDTVSFCLCVLAKSPAWARARGDQWLLIVLTGR